MVNNNSNLYSALMMNEVAVPRDVISQILVLIENPKFAQVCKMFQSIIYGDFYWRTISKKLALSSLTIRSALSTQADFSRFMRKHMQEQTQAMKKVNPRILGRHDEQPLDALHHANLEKHLSLHSKCRELDEKFTLNSTFDSSFNDNMIGSIPYCFDFMEEFILKNEIHQLLYSKCKELEPRFELSTAFDPDNFNEEQSRNIDGRIQYMKKYLVNMFDIAGLMTNFISLAEFKEYVEKL